VNVLDVVETILVVNAALAGQLLGLKNPSGQ